MTIYELFKKHKHRQRIVDITRVFFEEEFGYLVTQTKLHRHLPFQKKIKAYVAKEKLTNPEVRLRRVFERLGPTFLKFGQLLSLRPDLVPPEYITEFEKMQDHVPPISFKEVKRIIEEELKKPLDKVFSSFETTPLASASIGQVHKAKIGNQFVAVKVQRPGIKEIIEEDIELMYLIAELVEKEVPKLRDYRLKTIIHEFEKWTLKELNFNIEAYYAKKIAKNFQNSRILKVPKIYDEYTTNKVLVMEFIEGIPLHNIEKIKKAKINLHKVIHNGYYVILKQVFVDGFFHADPHPGNILVLKDGKIGLIDFGILGHFDKKLKKYALDIFNTFIHNDPDKAVDVLLQMNPTSDVDKDELRQDVRDIFEQLSTTSIEDLEIGPLIRETLAAANKHHMEIPADFVLYGKTVSIIEGIALRYMPNFNFFNETKTILKELIDYKFLANEFVDRTKDKVSDITELVSTFPETAKEILDKMRRFKFDIDIEDKDVRQLSQELERSSGNIAMGMIIAALIIGSSLIMQAAGSRWLYYGGFVLSGLLGMWLIHRTLLVRIYGE
ncbi:AarF/ABC1/UbiB kinase family protein [Candidatus Woesearchaeota archaeon]|nr:AarF/ABC1/UbiB kinase family protein [Candidatus Woesearchaeota archaeon]